MADTTKDNGTPEQTRRAKPSFSKTALPYIVGAIVASTVMAWYFFVFVPAKLDYFVGLKFRTLAIASGHVGAKVLNMARALRSVPTDCQSTTASPSALGYVRLVLPEIQADGPDGPRTTGLRLNECGITGTVAWPDVMAQAAAVSRRDFDDLVLANEDGQVVWQREISTPRIGNLTELLGATNEPGAFWSLSWRERATVHVEQDKKHLRSTAVLKTLNLGGRSSVLLVESVTVPSAGILPTGKGGQDATTRTLYVGGVASREALQRQAMRVPAAWVVFFALPVMMLFLAIPFFKLRTLMPRERFRYVDLLAMMLATVAAAGLGAIVPFVRAPTSAGDPTLDKFHDEIEARLALETGQVLELAHTILAHRPRIEAKLGTVGKCRISGSGIRKASDAGIENNECGLWKALGVQEATVELDVVLWFNEQGDQVRKWTTKQQITGPASHRPFDHFRDLTSGRLWTLSSPAHGRASSFTIEPLRAPTTSELGVMFAMPAPPEDGKRVFLGLNVRPQSLVGPIVPPGFGFAIVGPSGRVLFHSEEALSLEENFFEEVGEPRQVRERAHSNRLVRWMGDYHGRPHRFRMQPVQTFNNSPWLIVTFQELDPELSEELLQQSGTLRFGILNLLLLGAIVLCVTIYSSARHRRMRDLLQTALVAKAQGTMLVWILVFLAIDELIALGATYLPQAHMNLDNVYVVFLATPAIAILSTILARRWQKEEHVTPLTRAERRFVSLEPALLLILVAALPAMGFTRIVQITLNVKGAERWLENVNERWTAREARVAERVNDPNYDDDTRKLLRRGFAARRTPLEREAGFTYLNILGSVTKAGLSDGFDRPTATGQGLVRRILEWNVLTSKDEPAAGSLLSSRAAHQVSFQPAIGQLAQSSIDVSYSSRGFSRLGFVLGWGIMAGAIVGVYWARRRILWPTGDTFPAWSAYRAPKVGNHAVLVIGPPHTRKDELVRKKIKEVARIRLLEGTLTEEGVRKYVQRVESAIRTKNPAAKETVWILVSNLESQLVDQECRRLLLKLLDRLLTNDPEHPRGVVVTTSVDPVAHFRELFDEERVSIYTDDAPEVSLSRAALLLSGFERRYVPLSSLSREQCRKAWDSWWSFRPDEWEQAMEAELAGLGALAQVNEQLRKTFNGQQEVSFEKLVRELRRRANAYYELLWTNCTRKEKLVLIQLAQEGFVTAQSWDVVASLVAKGLVVEQPVPMIFNHTFREFLIDIERSGVIQEWERMEGNGLWQVAGRLVGASLVAGGVFFLLTQDFSVQSLLPIVSGTGMFGAPLFRTILAKMSSKPLEATA